MTQSKKDRKKEQGFTLIEIVAVLVILGILAAVAVPRYFDLQATARSSAATAAVAETQARLNSEFANRLLRGDTCATAVTTAVTNVNAQDLGNNWDSTIGTIADNSAPVTLTFNAVAVTNTTGTPWTVAIPDCQ